MGAIITENTGILGLMKVYKDLINEIFPSKSKMAYLGCSGVCLPFVELLAYSIREKGHEMFFIPDNNLNNCRRIVQIEGIGIQAGKKAKPKKVSCVIVMGGMAYPQLCLTPEGTMDIIERLLEDGKTISVCSGDIFSKAGWRDKIKFDYSINLRKDHFIEIKNECD